MKKIKPLPIIILLLILVLLIVISMHLFSKHKSSTEIKSRFSELIYKYEDFDDELPVTNLNSSHSCCKKVNFIKIDEAFEDVEYLFSLLKYGYSAYEYFGGDEVFKAAKESIQTSLSNLKEDNIPTSIFTDILYSQLSFIQDSHFILGSYKLCNYTKYYSSRKLTFYKDKIGFLFYW